MKVNQKVCEECALGPNSVAGEDMRKLIHRASEIGITYNCHWPEFNEGDDSDDLRIMFRLGGSPYCRMGLELLLSAWQTGSFTGELH